MAKPTTRVSKRLIGHSLASAMRDGPPCELQTILKTISLLLLARQCVKRAPAEVQQQPEVARAYLGDA